MWGENSLRVVAGLGYACRKEPDTRSVKIIVIIIIIILIMTIMLIVINSSLWATFLMALQNLNIHDWLSLLPILNTGSNLQNIDRISDIFIPIDLIKDVIKLIKIYAFPHPLQHHLRIPLSPGSRWFPLSSARAPQTNLMLIQMMMIAMKLMMMTTTSLMRIMNDDLWI